MINVTIYNKDCVKCVQEDLAEHSVDCVVTSPPYGGDVNVSVVHNKTYDKHVDKIDIDGYNRMCVDLFKGLESVLKPNGVICWNVSYNGQCSEQFIHAIHAILVNTEFTIGEVIVWKKDSAMPIGQSSNRLTRICELVYVFIRRSEYLTYYCNKPCTSISEKGTKGYANISNFIQAKNKDEHTDLNLATFSTDFASKLINLYCPVGGTVYDPFMGTGTTAKACIGMNRQCVGSEISLAQCEYAKKRIDSLFGRVTIIKPEQAQ